MGTTARVQGQHWSFSSDNNVQQSVQISECSFVNSNEHPAINRLIELSNLQDGWYDDEIESKSPSDLSISLALRLLKEISQLLEIVSIYPLYEGGILFEFEIEYWDYSLYINDSGSFELFGIQIDGNADYDAVFANYETTVDEMIRLIKN